MHPRLRPLALLAGAVLLSAPAWAQTPGTSGPTAGTAGSAAQGAASDDPHSRHDVGKVIAINVSAGTLSIQTRSQGVVTYAIPDTVQVVGAGNGLDDVHVGDEVRVDYAVYGTDRTVSRLTVGGASGTQPASSGSSAAAESRWGSAGTTGTELPVTSTFFPALGLGGALALAAWGALARRRRR